MFLEFGVLTCAALGSRKRSRFWVRLGFGTLVMVALALGLAFGMQFSAPSRTFGLAWMTLLLAALAVPPVFCFHTFTRSSGSSDGDGGGGNGGQGFGPPLRRPDPPRSGLPLPDADQARTRRRDHHRPSLRHAGRRRPADAPARPAPP